MNFIVDPIACDGNCFYRAVAKAVLGDESRHAELRKRTMDHLRQHEQTYLPFFESSKSFRFAIAANRRDGVWNTDITDIAISALPQILNITLHIYNTENDTKFIVGNEGEVYTLQRVNDSHYNILIQKLGD